MPSQRKNCEAYRSFKGNLERARAFLRQFDVDRKSGRPSRDETEFLRGYAVIAIGALDSLVELDTKLHPCPVDAFADRFGLRRHPDLAPASVCPQGPATSISFSTIRAMPSVSSAR